MDNYKIKVKDEAESKEVISLLVQLGRVDSESDRFGFVYTIGKKIGCDFLKHWDYYTGIGYQELTLPQLRDLVVLKRNWISDSNYSNHGRTAYLDSDGNIYNWSCTVEFWEKTEDSPITKDQGLIIGAEAYDLIGKRVEVEAYCEQIDGSYEWQDAKHLPACDILNDGFDFRLKPTTLTVNAELPKPSNTTLHNQNYSVTYEFSSREDRNAFVEGLGGNNS